MDPLERFGTEVGDVLLSVQLALADDERGGEPIPPTLTVPSHRPVEAEAEPGGWLPSPWNDGRAAAVIPLRARPGELPRGGPRPWHPSVPLDEATNPPIELDLIDGTGAGSLRALRRDVAAELAWGARTEGRPSVVGLVIEPAATLRERDGDAAAEALLKAVVDVVPFLVRGRDRIYRTSLNELALLMPATDGQGVESALRRLMDEVPQVLARRKLGEVRLVPRRVPPETLGVTASG